MIRVSSNGYSSSPDIYVLTASANSPYYYVSSRLGVIVGGTHTGGDSAYVNVDWISQGHDPHGEKRDKSVMHNRYDGDISFPRNLPYAVNQDGSLHIVASDNSSINIDSIGSPDFTEHESTVTPKTSYSSHPGWIYTWGGSPSISLSLAAGILTMHSTSPGYTARDRTGRIMEVTTSSEQYSFNKVELRNGALYISASYPTLPQAAAAAATLSPYCLRKVKLVQQSTGDINSLCELVRSKMHVSLLQGITSTFDFGSMSVDIAKSQKYIDQNILLICEDLIQLKTLLSNPAKGAQDVEDVLDITQLSHYDEFRRAMDLMKEWTYKTPPQAILKQIAKGLSSSVLTWMYAISPNIGDAKRFVTGIQKKLDSTSSQRLHSRTSGTFESSGSLVSVNMCLTCETLSMSQRDWPLAMELISSAKRWGMYPELQNLYDIIPFSFAVDWFVQFGDFFAAIDNYMYLENYFPVLYSVVSAKATCSYPASAFFEGATGGVLVTQYERWIMEGGLPQPSISLSASSTLSKHWVETGALVVQRL